MQAIIEKISQGENHSFYVNELRLSHFTSPWHFHPEIEIILITEGTGTVFIGEGVKNFKPGDLVIIGANVPHVWLNDELYYQDDDQQKAAAIYIQFLENFWGNAFLKLPELKQLKLFFNQAKRGIRFEGKTLVTLARLVKEMISVNELERISKLLRILNTMVNASQYRYLSPISLFSDFDQKDCEKINRVFEYVKKHFAGNITLEEISQQANLAPTAFCRYFKSRTNKTFSRFLNEVRISYACKLLVEKKLNVVEICYQSGFHYLSNFNRQFKKIIGFTPSTYQKKRAG
jgi:AraC-like DNA-binding protein